MKLCLDKLIVLETHNLSRLQKAIASKRPLITLANHDATVDDPLLFGMIDPAIWPSDRMRWTLGAQDICFHGPVTNRFFSAGRAIPIRRGQGIHQPAMDFAIERLNEGGWVHIFPEARYESIT